MIHGTLHERHELKKELRMMLFAQKGGRSPLVESRAMSRITVLNERYVAELAAEVLLEALKKDDLRVIKAMMILYKDLSSLADDAGISTLRNIMKIASKEMNKYTAESGGPLSFLKKGISSLAQKIGGDSASSNPIVKGQTLTGVLTAGFSQLNDILESNIDEYDPESDSSPMEQLGISSESNDDDPFSNETEVDEDVIENVKNMIKKAFEPEGFYAKLKGFFGGTGIPYMKRSTRDDFIEEILNAPASALTRIVEKFSSYEEDTPNVERSLRRTSAEMEDAPGAGADSQDTPIKNSDDLASLIARANADETGKNPASAARAAEKNPKKVNSKFLKYIADKSGEDPELVSKVIVALIKANRLKADSSILESHYKKDVLSLSDVTRAHRLLIESGGSSRKWAQLLVEAKGRGIDEVDEEEIFKAAMTLKLNKDSFIEEVKSATKMKGKLVNSLKLGSGAKKPIDTNALVKKYVEYVKSGGKAGDDSPSNDNQVVKAFDGLQGTVEKLNDESEAKSPPSPTDMKDYAKAVVMGYNKLIDVAKTVGVKDVMKYEKAVQDISKLVNSEKFSIEDLTKLAEVFDELKKQLADKEVGDDAMKKLATVKSSLDDANKRILGLWKEAEQLSHTAKEAKAAAEKIANELESNKEASKKFKKMLAGALETRYEVINDKDDEELRKIIAAFIDKKTEDANAITKAILGRTIDQLTAAGQQKTKEAEELKATLDANSEKAKVFEKGLIASLEDEMPDIRKKIEREGIENVVMSLLSKDREMIKDVADEAGLNIHWLKADLKTAKESAAQNKERADKLETELGDSKKKMTAFITTLAQKLGKDPNELQAAIDKDGFDKVVGALIDKKPDAVEVAAGKAGVEVPESKPETGEDKKKQVAVDIAKQLDNTTPDQISKILAALPEWLMVESRRQRKQLFTSHRGTHLTRKSFSNSQFFV